MLIPIAHSRCSLHLVISTNKPKEWVLSVVHNSQSIYIQRFLCHDLSVISMLNLPCLLLGDFNAIQNSSKHKDGSFDH